MTIRNTEVSSYIADQKKKMWLFFGVLQAMMEKQYFVNLME